MAGAGLVSRSRMGDGRGEQIVRSRRSAICISNDSCSLAHTSTVLVRIDERDEYQYSIVE